MNNYRSNARFAGAMFILAIVASIVGGTMIEGVISQPNLENAIADGTPMIALGVALEIINALAVIGIIIALRPPLKQQNRRLTLWWAGVRIVEATACIMALIIPVVLVIFVSTGNVDGAFIEKLITARDTLVNYIVTIFFATGALLFYTMLYRSRLVPRYISIWGMIAVTGVVATLVVPTTTFHLVLAVAMILNEVYLGIYLLVKGFRTTS